MKLRHDPRMSYRGILNWPPLWIEQHGESRISGDEAGVLTGVNAAPGSDKCYLYIERREKTYIGCVLFDNAASFSFVIDLLKRNIGKRIQTIGDLDVAENSSA